MTLLVPLSLSATIHTYHTFSFIKRLPRHRWHTNTTPHRTAPHQIATSATRAYLVYHTRTSMCSSMHIMCATLGKGEHQHQHRSVRYMHFVLYMCMNVNVCMNVILPLPCHSAFFEKKNALLLLQPGRTKRTYDTAAAVRTRQYSTFDEIKCRTPTTQRVSGVQCRAYFTYGTPWVVLPLPVLLLSNSYFLFPVCTKSRKARLVVYI